MVSGQRHAPAVLYPTAGTRWTGGWVGPLSGLDTEDGGKILGPCQGLNPDRPVVQPVVRHYTAWANPAPINPLKLSGNYISELLICNAVFGIVGFCMVLALNSNYFLKQLQPVDLLNGVLFEVWTEFLNIIYTSFSFRGLSR
jgi:hypothetical protein